jgi:hypothetical protein
MRITFSCGKRASIFSVSRIIPKYSITVQGPTTLCLAIGVEFIFHLLDDFLTIDRPDSCAERNMTLMTTLFKRLNIPIAKHKVVGPCTVIEYLGIILDTEKMEARLPQEKVIRICDTRLLYA